MRDTPKGRQFIGRDGELARLAAALGRANAGAGRTTIVGGEAGIGKTRLLEQFAAAARADGAQVLLGGCIDFGGHGLPFAPFVEALRAFVRSVEPVRLPALLGPARRGLARLLPELDERPGDFDGDFELDRSGQARLFEVVLNVLERISRTTPVALIVEDVQWADDDTRDMLSFLIRHLRSARVLIVLSVRTGDADRDDRLLPFLAELERDEWVERIELASFDGRELGRLLASATDRPPSAQLLEEILARSSGNPFYAEQLLAIVRTDGSGPGPLPQQLQDILAARLAGLPPMTLEVVRVASAAGARIDDEMLGAALDLPPRELTEALRNAIDGGILVADIDPGSDGYAFHHRLLQEVAYRQLLPRERTRLHAAFAADLLARRHADSGIAASELAFHLDGARQYRQAVPVYVEAGRSAERAFAFGQAASCYERALELWDSSQIPDTAAGTDRVWVMFRAAECALLTGNHKRAIELGHGAIAIQEQAHEPDEVRLGHLRERFRWFLWDSGDRAAAEAAVADALRTIPEAPPSPARARAVAQAAGLRMEGGDLRAAMQLAGSAISIAQAVGAAGEEALAGGILGWCQAVSGEIDIGTKTYRDALSIAERLGGAEGIALGHAHLAALLDRVGRTKSSLEVALDGYAIVRRLGVSRTYGGALLAHAAKALFDLGRWSEATSTADQGLDLDPVGRAAIELHLARARIDANQGRHDEAATHLHRARELSDAPGLAAAYRPSLLAGEADLARWQRRLADVRAAVDEGIGLVSDDRPLDPALGSLAEIGLGAEADAAATARARRDAAGLAEASARATEIGSLVDRAATMAASAADPRRDAVVALCSAERGRLRGSSDGSDWARVAKSWDALGRAYAAAYARFRQGEAVLGSGGSRTLARDALRRAHAVALELDARPLRSEIELLARHARIGLDTHPVHADGSAPDAVDDPTGFGLTERETEVIRLVAAGWSNQQIADALFIARKTASVHVSNILGKFGVGNRVEAAAIAHRLGLAGDVPLAPQDPGSSGPPLVP